LEYLDCLFAEKNLIRLGGYQYSESLAAGDGVFSAKWRKTLVEAEDRVAEVESVLAE